IGVAAFEPGDDAQRLCIVVEAAPGRHLVVERFLPGMAEGRVPEIMDERDRLRQVLVAAQRPRQGASNLRDLDRMSQSLAKVVALVRNEDLRLVLQPPEGGRMDDAVAVALEGCPRRAFRLVIEAAAAPGGVACIGRARPVAEADFGKIAAAHARSPVSAAARRPVDLPRVASYLGG